LAGKTKTPHQLSAHFISQYYPIKNKLEHVSTVAGMHIYKHETSPREGYSSIDYLAHDPKTNKVHFHMTGVQNKKNIVHVETLAGSGKAPIKASDFYHHLLKHHVTALVGSTHSEGGQKTWQRLANKKTVSVHGWLNNKPVNLDPKNPDETHASYGERWRAAAVGDHEPAQRARTELVASYHPLKKLQAATRK
jgi:hypothetical protein